MTLPFALLQDFLEEVCGFAVSAEKVQFFCRVQDVLDLVLLGSLLNRQLDNVVDLDMSTRLSLRFAGRHLELTSPFSTLAR